MNLFRLENFEILNFEINPRHCLHLVYGVSSCLLSRDDKHHNTVDIDEQCNNYLKAWIQFA